MKTIKIGYTAISKKGEKVDFYAVSSEQMIKGNGLDAYNTIINFFDHSDGRPWNYYPNGKFKHQ
jgi:hypothetical protein